MYVFAGLVNLMVKNTSGSWSGEGVPVILIPFLSSWLSRKPVPHSFHPDVHT